MRDRPDASRSLLYLSLPVMATRAAAKRVHLFNISPAPGSLHHVCVFHCSLVTSRVQGHCSKNESEGVRDLVMEVPLVVATRGRKPGPVLAPNPVSRVGKRLLRS